MKVLIQWALATPGDWEEIDSGDWPGLPTKPVPVGGESLDDLKGWINALNVQGVIYRADHYAVEDLPDGACRITAWSDDPEDWAESNFIARRSIFRPLAPSPDRLLRGQINTDQKHEFWGGAHARETLPDGNHPIREFIAPVGRGLVRHGIWVPDRLFVALKAARKAVGWRSRKEALDPEELDENGCVKCQRAQGRFLPNRGTRTYFQRDTTLAVTWPPLNDNVNELNASTATASTATVADASIPNNETGRESFVFTSPAGEPNSAAWPTTGNYRIQYDISSIDGTVAIETTQFHRVNAAGTSSLQQFDDTTDLSATGLSIRQVVDQAWSAGTDTDRIGVVVLTKNSSGHGGIEEIILNVNTVDEFIDGPWDSGAVTFTYSGSGGATSGGQATFKKIKVFAASGGATSGGAAGLKKEKVYLASGGGASGGAATTQKQNLYTYSGAGGGTSGGAAATVIVTEFLYTGSGGATSGGAAGLKKEKVYLASGGATSGGAAGLKKEKVYPASGGATSGGVALTSITQTFTYAGSGGGTSGGVAATAEVFEVSYSGSGGGQSGGAAAVKTIKCFIAAGGGASGGAAATVFAPVNIFTYSGSGGGTSGGAAAVKTEKVYTASGGGQSGGAALTSNPTITLYSGSGGGQSGGAALTRLGLIIGRTSAAFHAAAFARETGEAFLILLTIEHPTLDPPLRFVNNTKDIVSNGKNFVAYPFEINLPDDSDTVSARAKLRIDNVDQSIVAAIRVMTTPPTVTMEIILASAPDVIEVSFPNFALQNVTYDGILVEGELSLENFTGEPYPGVFFGPANFPGLF